LAIVALQQAIALAQLGVALVGVAPGASPATAALAALTADSTAFIWFRTYE